jgi:hypothetical protein
MARSISMHLKRELSCNQTRTEIKSRLKLLKETLKSNRFHMYLHDDIRDAENCIAALKMLLR